MINERSSEEADSPQKLASQSLDDRGSGFTGRVRVENVSDQPVDDWVITLDITEEVALSNVWSATSSEADADSIRFEALGWNEVIAPGQSVNFGFKGSPGDLGSPGITLEEITIA